MIKISTIKNRFWNFNC